MALLIRKVYLFSISLLLFLLFANCNLLSQNLSDDLEEISMLMQVPGYGTFSVEALYSNDQKVFLDVESFFTTLKITCISGRTGDSLGGFIGQEKRQYVINYTSRTITLEDEVTECNNGMLKKMGIVYLESSFFKLAFGIELKFNFRSLMITVKSEFELPVIKEMRLNKARQNILKLKGETLPDTTITRLYHFLKFGTVNWSLMSSQLTGSSSDNLFGLGIGAELLFGELDISLTYSPQKQFSEGQQQFLWRWVDNEKPIMRQVQAGKISGQMISTIYSPTYGVLITNSSTAARRTE